MRRLALMLVLLVPGLFAQATGNERGKGVPFFKGERKVDLKNTRTVTGLVRDKDDKPAPKALVTLTDKSTGKSRTMFTGPEGEYSFDLLNKRVDYELIARHKGASSKVRILSSFNETDKPVVNLKVEPKETAGEPEEKK